MKTIVNRRARLRPEDALIALRDPERIRFASNPFQNERWWHADARTRGADRLLVAEAFADRAAVDAYAEEVTRIVHLPISELIAFVQGDPRMLLVLRDKSRDEPWDDDSGKTRPIVVPTVLRRCLSNLLADVLEVTCDHLLPPCAVAYRPGNHDVVAETIIDVASDVYFGGKVYFWKFDLRKAFPSLPWRLVRRALRAMKLPAEFIEFAMALVAAPIVREVHGKLVPVPNDKGCQAGLPESSILLNVVMKPIDEVVTDAFPALTYKRYSDDGILAHAQRHLLVGAARRILTWARENVLQLKGLSPDQGAQSLVCDIREQVLPLLGAEIHADGDIHLPEAKIERQIRKLTFMIENTPEVVGEFEVIAGRSKYSSGGRSRGSRIYDRRDFQESFKSFFAHAFRLNQGDALLLIDRVREELRTNPQLPPCKYNSLVWVAALGDPGLVQAGGHRNLHRTDPALLKVWSPYTTALKDQEPIDLGEVEGSGSESDVVEEERGDSAHWAEEGARERAASLCPGADGEEDRDVGDPSLHAEEWADDDADEPEGPWAESGAWSLCAVDDEGAPSLEGALSDEPSDVERSALRSARFLPVSPADLSSRAEHMGQDPEPPGVWLRDNALVVHLVARRVARRRADGGTVVGTQLFDRSGDGETVPRTTFWDGMHEASSIMATIERLREAALRDEYDALLVLFDDAELPKALLQRHRAFRKPALFRRVLDLHAPHPIPLVIAGPWEPPARLLRRVEDDCDACRRSLRDGSAHVNAARPCSARPAVV